MGNINNNVFDQYIVLKKYISEEEKNEIQGLEDKCVEEDKVNMKLELNYRSKIEKDYKKDNGDINEFLNYLNNELIAYLSISNFGGNIAEINGMTHPGYRRRGIFTKIVTLALEECKKRKFSEVLLLCDDKSYSGMKFIEGINGEYSFSECRMNCIDWRIEERNNNILLEKANNDKIYEINRLNGIFFGDIWSESILPEDEDKDGTTTYLIVLQNKTIGKIKVTKDLSSAFISGFGIIPEFRGKGYGKAILVEVLNNLNKENINKVSLDVEIKNKSALYLYKSCGFKEESIMNYYSINI